VNRQPPNQQLSDSRQPWVDLGPDPRLSRYAHPPPGIVRFFGHRQYGKPPQPRATQKDPAGLRRLGNPSRRTSPPTKARSSERSKQHRRARPLSAEVATHTWSGDHSNRLTDELTHLARYPLIIIDEVGDIPFDPDAANLFFHMISARYERASIIVTSNKPFGRWGEVFGDDTVAAAMIDRLVHHAEVISLKGDSYRLRNRDLGRVPTANTTD